MSTMNPGKFADKPMNDDISQLRDDLAQLRKDVAILAEDLLGTAKSGASAAAAAAKKRGAEVAEALEDQIQEHPLSAVGVAFGVGLLVGAILRRV
jgi:ElaB/YqjD/DUF883 family membrane-anchored ribosome-binding protein